MTSSMYLALLDHGERPITAGVAFTSLYNYNFGDLVLSLTRLRKLLVEILWVSFTVPQLASTV